MVPRLKKLVYEDRLRELHLLSLEQRRERGDMIAICRLMMKKDYLDRDDLLVWDTWETRGHRRKLKKSTCRRDIKMKSFPQRSVDTWNGLDKEAVQAKLISVFKDELDKSSYGDGTVRA